jgi:hypothetical protein
MIDHFDGPLSPVPERCSFAHAENVFASSLAGLAAKQILQ